MIEEYLKNRGVGYEVDQHELAYTAQEEAAAEHVSGYEFAKTVIVTDGEEFFMLVLPAPYQADMEKAGALIGREVRLAEEEEIRPLFTDCDLGAEPPFGSVFNLETYADESLGEQDEIVFRAGSHEKVIKIDYEDWEELENPSVGEIRAGTA